jgi:lipopolysaccharide/colanic/teichoic acid biosynthesis glycosyltransferase
MYRKFFKRVIDIIISVITLLILFPLILLISIILIFLNKGKVFFIQSRPGRYEKGFKLFKFRTMTDVCDEKGDLLPNYLRITPTGRFLRNYSLDEIPQIMNVIIGDMSLVGPRPLLFKYIPLYSEEQKKRHLVKPGITGWAQVNGRNAISWTRKFELDLFYVENVSFLLDMKILCLTAKRTIKTEGINAGKEVTMPPFNGKN